MPTITDILKDAEGAVLAGCSVEFESVLGPSVNGAAIISKTRCRKTTDDDGEFSIELAPGRYVARWKCRTIGNSFYFDVPEADGDYVLREQRSAEDLGYTSGVIRYGSSAAAILDGGGILGLSNTVTRARPEATITLPSGAGTYKHLAWPDRLGSPSAVDGFWDSASGQAIVMADADDGYEHSQNGWHYILVPVNGVAHRVYRTKYALGAAIPILLS